MISISLLNGAKSLIRGEYKEMMSGIGSIKSKVVNNYQIRKRLAEIKGYHKIPTITNSIFTKTKITKKEYSVSARSREIKDVLKKRKKVEFEELFEIVTKDYVVVTFLSILSMAKKGELIITQNDNFSKIVLSLKEGE